MTGEAMTARGAGAGVGAGRAPHLQPPHANHPLQALRTDDIEVQVIEQGIELCSSSERKSAKEK
ncbi:AGAP013415-PA-like protein [Anopheles sinensis]|uniref:AGAP013415-PA-like protein n=1 Tax=Anopheles sinensis TaxID=74873 RepID=A0A084VKB9_ANOSI|nr:AGAP013415-PA-like protein [Anopheles sinensis]